jgi:hypothetical protein
MAAVELPSLLGVAPELSGLGAPLSAPEVEYLAEFESVAIIPNFRLDGFSFLGVRGGAPRVVVLRSHRGMGGSA